MQAGRHTDIATRLRVARLASFVPQAADNAGMQISRNSSAAAVAPASKPAASGGSDDTAALQKQLRDLTDQLKETSSDTSLNAKAREQKTRLLQAQIQAVQAQIAAIQRQKQQEQIESQRDNADTAAAPPPAKNGQADKQRGSAVNGLGANVDTFA